MQGVTMAANSPDMVFLPNKTGVAPSMSLYRHGSVIEGQ
jgi:hypothetical protein